MSRESTSITDSTFCINKAMLCPGNADDDHVSEEVLNGLQGQIEKNVDPFQYRPSAKTDFPVEFQITFSI
jgi:hypothetical protein